jgi:hypothetical protein
LSDLQPDITNTLGAPINFQTIQIHLHRKNPKAKDIALNLETVEEGIRIAVKLTQELIDDKRIQPFSLENNTSSNFLNFKEQIKDIYNYKETAEEKINELILMPRVLERFERVDTIGYCPVSGCGAQLTAYYCANGHYYY